MFLGVDGGGTKTAYCLIDDDGVVRARALTAGIHYLTSGIGIVAPLLREGITRVCADAGITPDAITYSFLGIPCYGEDTADVAALDALPAAYLRTGRY
ncbi:BadF/BadG/BcrA/BcrD ATPase family protein, partial [Actinoplanes philippinensis]|uniref:BadF/BadG/BcrA/BcrD ATPase family protein n=1 Tax=Actinoplanes philippinensis TaxID=35752 RepID=UPI0033E7533F